MPMEQLSEQELAVVGLSRPQPPSSRGILPNAGRVPMPRLREGMTSSEAVKVDNLVGRMLGDLGSIFLRAYSNGPMPPELHSLRRFLRDTQDQVRDAHPEAFFK
jgi:hypothetical protein